MRENRILARARASPGGVVLPVVLRSFVKRCFVLRSDKSELFEGRTVSVLLFLVSVPATGL
jgi:hypothetical protein